MLLVKGNVVGGEWRGQIGRSGKTGKKQMEMRSLKKEKQKQVFEEIIIEIREWLIRYQYIKNATNKLCDRIQIDQNKEKIPKYEEWS